MTSVFKALLPLVFLPQTVLAEGIWDQIDGTFGIGVVGTSGVYVGQDDELYPFPYLALTFGNVTVNLAKGVEYSFRPADNLQLSTALTFNGAPDQPETALFQGLDRDAWIGGELAVVYELGSVDLGLTTAFDVSGEHDGYSSDLSIGQSFPLGEGMVEATIGATFLDANYAGYLYGVANGEVTAARAVYAPGGNWTPRVEVSALYPVSQNTAVAGFFEHAILPDAISDSPLVGVDERTTIGLTWIRKF